MLPLRQVDQLSRLRGSRGKRLFDEYMLAVLEGRFGEFEVRPDGRDHRNSIDFRGMQDVFRLRR